MRERAITRTVARVDIAMIMPAVAAVKGPGIHTHAYEIVLLSAIVTAGFVAVEQLHQITLS